MEHSLTYIKILADAQNLLAERATGAAEIEKSRKRIADPAS